MQHRINHPSVISESIDGEVVIIALTTGAYYSLRGAGARAWDGIAAGLLPDQVVADLEQAFVTNDVDVSAALDAFLATLVTDGLIIPGEPLAAAPAPPAPVDAAQAWKPMALETFTDMQDLILLDPVHEVEPGRGWPVALETTDPAS